MKCKHLKHLFTALLLLCCSAVFAQDAYTILPKKVLTPSSASPWTSELFVFKEPIDGLRVTYLNTYNGEIYSGNNLPMVALAELSITDAEGNPVAYSVTTNSLELSEGSLEALYDNDPNTFYHSIWKQGTLLDSGFVYLELSFERPMSEFRYSHTKRSSGKLYPKLFTFSNMGETIAPQSYLLGEKVIGVLDEENGILTVSGTGNMYNSQSLPTDLIKTIKTVVIEDGVTSIGDDAFYNCTGLTSVVIGNSVKSIGNYAFYNCTGLTSVVIGNSVKSIGSDAFCGCTGLTSVEFNAENCTTMSSSVFNGCTALSTVTIGENVKIIPAYAFYHCIGLTSVEIPNSITSIGERAFRGCSGLTSVVIPNSVTSIGDLAFGFCDGLTSVVIGNSVTSIGERAFYDCTGLTSVVIPNSVTSIGDYAFYGCTGLTSVVIGNSVTSIGESAFYGCTGIETVVNLSDLTFTKGGSSNGFVAYYANNLCNAQNSIVVGDFVFSKLDGVNTLIAYYGNPNLAELTLPANCDGENYVIGDDLLYGCQKLRSVTIGSGVLSVGNNVFSTTPTKVIFLGNTPPSGVSKIKGTVNYVSSAANYGFGAEYTNLSSMFEVGGVKYVLVSAKDRTCDVIDCNYNNPVENIVIDSLVTYRNVKLKVRNINDYALYDNDGIKDAVLNNNGYVGIYAFSDCDNLQNADVNNNGYVGDYAFSDCDNLQNAVVNNNGSIGKYAFSDCDNLQDAVVDNNGSIGDYAFYDCGKLQNATLGNSVGSIGSYAFAECDELAEIVIPDNVPSVGSYCFYNCTSLEKSIVGSGVRTLNTRTFSGCSSLNEVKIGEKVATIGTYVFENCSSLPQINIPKATRTVGNYVFKGCGKLATVVIEDKDISLNLGSNGSSPLFADCKLDSVYIGGKLQYNTTSSYGYSPFYGNKYLRSVAYNDMEVAIYDKEFMNCSNLRNIVFGKGISSIGVKAFNNCTSLPSITIPDEVLTMGNSCFAGCTAMKSAKVGAGVKALEWYSFGNCSKLKDMQIGVNVDSIGKSVFYNCKSLPQINIPQATTVINDSVFYNCSSLADVIIEDRASVLKLGSNGSSSSSSATSSTNPLFHSCPLDSVYIGGKISYKTEAKYGFSPFFRNTSLRTVVVSDTETLVYDNEFYGCTGLTDVVIGDGVTAIGNWAFSGCTGLVNFSFGSSVKTIGAEAFSDCTSMVKIVSSCNVPPVCGEQALADINVWDCTLYVPNDYTDAYYSAPQWWDFFFIDGAEYTITFMIGEEKYSEATIKYGAEIALPVPTKEGYTFQGWDDVPAVMPADNIVVYGSFKANDYIITYIVDGEVYDTVAVPCDAVVEPISAPEKDGYVFNHWEGMPQTMPACDVEVVAVYDEIPAEITVVIGQYGSTVFSSKYALDFSNVDGLAAYAATGYNTNSGVITMTKIETADEGMGLYLLAAPGEYKVPVIEYSEDNSLNLLVGNLEKSTVNAVSDDGFYANYKYTIKSGDATPKFYQYSDGSSISAGKAFLQIPLDWIGANASKAISIRFDDGVTTDIDDVEGVDSKIKTVYDLQGRSVNGTSNGVYVVNGEKVYIK